MVSVSLSKFAEVDISSANYVFTHRHQSNERAAYLRKLSEKGLISGVLCEFERICRGRHLQC